MKRHKRSSLDLDLVVRMPLSATHGERVLRDGDLLDDLADLGLEGRSAHQKAVDVRVVRELGGVLGCRGAAVLDADFLRRLLVNIFLDPVSDTFVCLLGLGRRGRDAGPDGPSRRRASTRPRAESGRTRPAPRGRCRCEGLIAEMRQSTQPLARGPSAVARATRFCAINPLEATRATPAARSRREQ